MTGSRTVVVHAVPVGRAAGHVVSTRCRCGPGEYRDLADPAVLVVVHRDRAIAATLADLDEQPTTRPHP